MPAIVITDAVGPCGGDGNDAPLLFRVLGLEQTPPVNGTAFSPYCVAGGFGERTRHGRATFVQGCLWLLAGKGHRRVAELGKLTGRSEK
eukprot:gene9776-biopygen6143